MTASKALRGEIRQTVVSMAARPDGVTSRELAEALGISSSCACCKLSRATKVGVLRKAGSNPARWFAAVVQPRRGVRSIEDLKAKCLVDEFDCWIYGPDSKAPARWPYVTLPPGVLGGEKWRAVPAAKAAWMLDGRTLADGEYVHRYICGAKRCINPAHGKAGRRAVVLAEIAATGRYKGNPARAAANLPEIAKRAKPRELVEQVEAMFASGASMKEVRKAFGLNHPTATSIRLGTHINSPRRQTLVHGASVFAWRPEA